MSSSVSVVQSRAVRAALLVGVAVFSGCASISEQTHAYLGTPVYPPGNPAAVQILTSEPNRAKSRLGEILLDVQGSPSRADIEGRLKTAAAKLGADAVFVVYDRTHIFPIVYGDWYWGPMGVTQDAHRNIVAIAIKYQ